MFINLKFGHDLTGTTVSTLHGIIWDEFPGNWRIQKFMITCSHTWHFGAVHWLAVQAEACFSHRSLLPRCLAFLTGWWLGSKTKHPERTRMTCITFLCSNLESNNQHFYYTLVFEIVITFQPIARGNNIYSSS